MCQHRRTRRKITTHTSTTEKSINFDTVRICMGVLFLLLFIRYWPTKHKHKQINSDETERDFFQVYGTTTHMNTKPYHFCECFVVYLFFYLLWMICFLSSSTYYYMIFVHSSAETDKSKRIIFSFFCKKKYRNWIEGCWATVHRRETTANHLNQQKTNITCARAFSVIARPNHYSEQHQFGKHQLNLQWQQQSQQ